MQPNQVPIGTNRTGVKASPIDAGELAETLDLVDQVQPTIDPVGADVDADMIRADYRAEADPIGSVPPPTSIKGVFGTAAQALQGNKLHVLLDKLAERAAYERSGTRLYEAAIVKLSADEAALPRGMSIAMLQEIRDEEAAHFALLVESIEQLGGDPTAQTPSADFTAVQSMGLFQAMGDPRITVAQALETLLAAELIDNASWELLIELVEGFGQDDLVERFTRALANEARHEQNVRSWLATALEESAHAGTRH